MPYITTDARQDMRNGKAPTTCGELNYLLSLAAARYVADNGLSYQTLNDVSGAMTEALAEFRRRIVVPYEDVKRLTGVDPYEHIRSDASEPDSDWATRLSGKN